MARMNMYSFLIIALSNLITALSLRASTTPADVPSNVANGTIVAGCTLFHSVNNGETCASIESEFGISDALFRALNPEINAGCTNLFAAESYCVQASNSTGGTGGNGGNSTIAPGTIVQGCTQFHTVVAGDNCLSVEAEFNITDSLFRTLNPEINAGCTNLILGLSYCVQTSNATSIPSNVSPGTITAGCLSFFTVPAGDSCTTVEQQTGISDSLFHALNPQINAACSNLIAGEAYCVATSNATTATR